VGEWVEYTINVGQSGTYRLDTRGACAVSGGGTLRFSSDGADLGTIAMPNTGGWNTFATAGRNVNLTAGTHVIRMSMDSGAANNVNWFKFVDVTPPTSPTQSFGFNTPVPQVKFAFSENVSASLTASDLVLRNFTTNAVVPTGNVAVS